MVLIGGSKQVKWNASENDNQEITVILLINVVHFNGIVLDGYRWLHVFGLLLCNVCFSDVSLPSLKIPFAFSMTASIWVFSS